MSDVTYSLAAVAGLLRWTSEFSEKLDRNLSTQMRMSTLRFVAQGFTARDPGFDLEVVARGEQPPGAPDGGVSLVTLIEAFRFFDQNSDPRGITAAMIIWHLISKPRASVIERA